MALLTRKPGEPDPRLDNLLGAVIEQQRTGLLVVKSANEEIVGLDVVKSEAPQHFTLGLAYPANRVDANVAADGYRDFVAPEVLEKTAWKWMKEQRDINLFHTDGTSGHADVVESYIYRGPDWHVGDTVIKSGDWMLGTVWDDKGWDMVQKGQIRGWSPEGGARRRLAGVDAVAKLRR